MIDATCDWPQLVGDWNWRTFRFIHAALELDHTLGQFELDLALLGFGVRLKWVFDPDTELRDTLANTDWLASSRVCMPYADYEALRADAEKWRGIPVESLGREKAP